MVKHGFTGDLKKLISGLKSKNGKNIFIDGGAEVVQYLLMNKLIDEFIISIIPVLLGNGTRLFREGRPEEQLQLISVKKFDKGLAQLHYQRVNQV